MTGGADPRLVVVVPARGGSQGVRRKNTRLLNGEPLVARAVRQVRWAVDKWAIPTLIVVTTDDPQIAQIARLAGATVVDRPADLAEGTVPVGEAVNHACQTLGWSGHTVVWQPSTIVDDQAADLFLVAAAELEPDASKVMVVKDHKLRWRHDDRGVLLLNHERAQRQDSTFEIAETGIFASGRWPAGGSVPPHFHIADDAFVGAGTPLLPTYVHRAVDVDTLDDLAAARQWMGGGRVVFRVDATREHGSGHLHRALTLADELQHLRPYLVGDLDEWAHAMCEQRGIEVRAGVGDANVVVVDTPHPDPVDLYRHKAEGRTVVVFEDDGPASFVADLTVNELLAVGSLAGPRYSVLRPEFLAARAARAVEPLVNGDGYRRTARVVVTFGGTDPVGAGVWATKTIAGAHAGWVDVTLVDPPSSTGEDPHATPMAELFATADLVVTSAGRTVHEAMCVGVPVISIPVNEREAARPAWSPVVRLPLLHTVTDDCLAGAVEAVLGDVALAARLSEQGRAMVDGLGALRVARAIETLALGLD
jgi:spore coat polysaccharide biosynthesis predicted glycosyltransferase SpsG